MTMDKKAKKELAHNGRGVVTCVICGLVAIAASLVILPGFMREVVGGKSVLICIAVCFALYACITSGMKCNRTANGYINCLCGAFVSVIICNLALWAVFFRTGAYLNYGLLGFYLAILICAAPFLITGITVTLLNKGQRIRC